MSQQETTRPKLAAGPDARTPWPQSIALGLQHVLAMDSYILPLVLGASIGLGNADLTYFVQMSFFACGVATLLQCALMKLPIVQGPSYVPLGAMRMIGSTMGIATLLGSLIPGAILMVALGASKLYSKFIRRVITPMIGGIIILIVGLTLVPTAISGIFDSGGYGLTINAVSGCVAFGVMLVCTVLQYALRRAGVLHLFSVIISLAAGTAVAWTMGDADFSAVAQASWFSLPMPFHFGVPRFDLGTCVLMAVIYLFVLIESTGTWFVIQDVAGEELTDRRVNRGTLGFGLGNLISALFGSTPVTGYSSNAGLIPLTKIASRRVFVCAGAILVALGFCPKLMAVVISLPVAVVDGVFAMVCVTLISAGMRIIRSSAFDDRDSLIVGISVLCGVATMVFPADAMAAAPQFLQYFLASGVAVGGAAAILLQLLLPHPPAEHTDAA